MDFEDLVRQLAPLPNRKGKQLGEYEHHLYEGAVMVAYAMHSLRIEPTNKVRIHPDGTHGKQFDFRDWFERHDFSLVS